MGSRCQFSAVWLTTVEDRGCQGHRHWSDSAVRLTTEEEWG